MKVGCPIYSVKSIDALRASDAHDKFFDEYTESLITHFNGKFIIHEFDLSEPRVINIGTKHERIYACSVNKDMNMIAI